MLGDGGQRLFLLLYECGTTVIIIIIFLNGGRSGDYYYVMVSSDLERRPPLLLWRRQSYSHIRSECWCKSAVYCCTMRIVYTSTSFYTFNAILSIAVLLLLFSY